MDIPDIPKNIDEWSLQTIEKLLPLPHIESETFDFKSEISELDEHICAMANSLGGIIVLGIGEEKSKDGKHLLRFKKIGFNKGKEEQILNQITDNSYNVEPSPKIDVNHIPEKNLDKFYTVLKITNKFSDKPYFIKTSDQCFVRLHNSKRRASRAIIYNLFSTNLEQRKNLEQLRSACLQTKEDFRFALRDAHMAQPTSTMKIPSYDLTYLRTAAISCETFLRERSLWGEHTGQSSFTHGVNSVLHDLNHFKTYVDAYNSAHIDERQSLKSQLSSWSLGSSSEESVIRMLDDIVKNIKDFFNKQE